MISRETRKRTFTEEQVDGSWIQGIRLVVSRQGASHRRRGGWIHIRIYVSTVSSSPSISGGLAMTVMKEDLNCASVKGGRAVSSDSDDSVVMLPR